jgi:hypothetical protein
MKYIAFSVICFLVQWGFSQNYQTLSGRLIYSIEFKSIHDSVPPSVSTSVLYTNDTLVRIESETGQLGPQVLIKHLIYQKYYLLLEYNDKKYAIQQHMLPDTIPSKYQFKRKMGRKKIAGMQAKRVLVSAKSFDQPIEMWYFPSYSAKYLDVLKGIPGLPVDYFIQLEDGMLHYKLEKMELAPVNLDLFGIPSDFKKITFDEFLEEMMQSN